jgi:hypothetical protein
MILQKFHKKRRGMPFREVYNIIEIMARNAVFARIFEVNMAVESLNIS